jgi:hypothetical protein
MSHNIITLNENVSEINQQMHNKIEFNEANDVNKNIDQLCPNQEIKDESANKQDNLNCGKSKTILSFANIVNVSSMFTSSENKTKMFKYE